MQAISSGDMNLFQNKVTEEINAANAPKQGAVKVQQKVQEAPVQEGPGPAGPGARRFGSRLMKKENLVNKSVYSICLPGFFHVCKQFYKTSVRLFSPIELT